MQKLAGLAKVCRMSINPNPAAGESDEELRQRHVRLAAWHEAGQDLETQDPPLDEAQLGTDSDLELEMSRLTNAPPR